MGAQFKLGNIAVDVVLKDSRTSILACILRRAGFGFRPRRA
jgi:hypothetical protein